MTNADVCSLVYVLVSFQLPTVPIFVVKAKGTLWRCPTTMTSCSLSVGQFLCSICYWWIAIVHGHVGGMGGWGTLLLVLRCLLLMLLCLQVSLLADTSQHSTYLTPHNTPCPTPYNTSHPSQHSTYTTPHMALQPPPLPLQSLKRLREREDTSSPWHRCPTPSHLVKGMSLRPSSDYMGWNLSSSISPSCLVWNNFIHLSPVNIVLMRCWDVLTLYIWKL